MHLLIRKLLSVTFLCSSIALLSCSSSPPIVFQHSLEKYNYVIAEADSGYVLTMPVFYDQLSQSKFMEQGGIVDKKTASDLIDSVLIDTLIGFRAATVNLRDHYEYYFRFREGALRQLINSYYENAVFSNVKVDTSEILNYIQEHPEQFTVKEQILVSHIVISTKGLRRSADSLRYKHLTDEELDEVSRQTSFDLRDSVDSKDSFAEIAKKYSHDETNGRHGGFIGWAERDVYAWPFDSVAFAAKPGDIVGPYRDQDGWQLLFIHDYVQEGVPPLNQDQLFSGLNAIQREKSRDIASVIFDTLMADIDIEYNEGVLDTNAYLVAKQTWAAVVNGIDTIDFGELTPGEESIRNKYKVSNSTVQMKKEMIVFLAQRWLIAQEARRMGLDTLASVRQAASELKHILARIIVETSQSNPSWEPSQEILKQYYDEHIDDYEVEKPLKVQQIVVSEISLAHFIRDQANAGVDFMRLAAEYYPGDESVKKELANLGWIGPDDVSREFFDAAKVTRAGEVSEPVKTEYGFHIIKVVDRNFSIPFEKARTGIRSVLKEKKQIEEITAFRNGLRQEFDLVKSQKIYPIHLKPFKERNNNL